MLQGELKGNLTNNVELKGELTVGGMSPNLVEGNFTENGEYVPVNADGYSKAIVNVQPDLVEGNFTENGEYVPVNADGYSKAIVNVKHTVVSAAAPFGVYGENTNYFYVSTYLEEGDTIVFALSCRSDITLPTGVELIFKSTTNWNSYNQYLMFAKYTASQNESHYFEFAQATTGRFFCTYAIFHDVTVVHSGTFLTYYNTTISTRTYYDVPDKQENEILFWGFSVVFAPSSLIGPSVLTTMPEDIFRISWPANIDNKYPRLVTFLDTGNGATHRIFTNTITPSQCNNQCVIDALQIIPN